MRILLSLTILFTFSTNLIAQKKHIKQSKPFENLLQAMKSDSTDLFINSFSENIVNGKTDSEVWCKRLQEGKAKFKKEFGDFQLNDFAYKYDKKESKLVIFFKGKEEIRLKVIKEKGAWKLDEK